jgi:hypothetical protein
MKTLAVKFTRNPQYTPASLTERQLSRIEWLVKAKFEREVFCVNEHGWDMTWSGKDAVKDMTTKWFVPMWSFDRKPHPQYGTVEDWDAVEQRKARHDQRIAWLTNNKDAQQYFSNCWNYLVACAKRNGDLKVQEQHSRQWYAERRGSY